MDKRYQWSLFINGKEEQVVLRNDDFEEWILDIEKVKTQFNLTTKPTAPVVAPQEPTREQLNEYSYAEDPHVECNHDRYWVNEVKKEGKNKGKHFKVCRDCKKFLEWTDEPLSKRE